MFMSKVSEKETKFLQTFFMKTLKGIEDYFWDMIKRHYCKPKACI